MKILVIIDMLNGFCRPGYPLSLGQSTYKLESYIANQIKQTKLQGGVVIFVSDAHDICDPEINNPYPLHCMKGTKEADIVQTLRPYAQDSIVLTKNTISVFYNTRLQEVLDKISVDEVLIAGVCTEICDLFAAYEFRIRGYKVRVNPDGILPLESKNQGFALDLMKTKLGVTVEEVTALA